MAGQDAGGGRRTDRPRLDLAGVVHSPGRSGSLGHHPLSSCGARMPPLMKSPSPPDMLRRSSIISIISPAPSPWTRNRRFGESRSLGLIR